MSKPRQKRRINNKQMGALEAFIAESRDAAVIARKILIWALRKTNNLSRPVHIFLIPKLIEWKDFFDAGGFRGG